MSKPNTLGELASDNIRYISAAATLKVGLIYIFEPGTGTYDLTLPLNPVQNEWIRFRNRSGYRTLGFLPNGKKFENSLERHNLNDMYAKGTIIYTNNFGWIYI